MVASSSFRSVRRAATSSGWAKKGSPEARFYAMRAHGVDIGPVEQVLVGIRIVAPDPVNELILPHHAHAGPCNACLVLQLFNIDAGMSGGKAQSHGAGMKKPGCAGL
jgi:hypothetical protein